jgi:hypothetical protein
MSYATFERFEIEIDVRDAMAASGPGTADDAVAALVNLPRIAAQLDEITQDDIRNELREYGAWDDGELADNVQNRHRVVWLACCDIRESAVHGPVTE